MTTIPYPGNTRVPSRRSSFALLVYSLHQTVKKLRDAWSRSRTERMLEGLDPEIRKDIGWPTTDLAQHRQ